MKHTPAIFDAVGPDGGSVTTPTRVQLVILTLAFWGAEFLLAEMRSIVDHSAKLELYTALRLLTATLGCIECYCIHRLFRGTALRSFAGRALILFVTAAAAGIANLKIGDVLQDLSSYPVSDYGMGWRIYNAVYWMMIFMSWAAIYLALCYSREAGDQERRGRVLEQLAHEAQVRALRFQVDPHFLFNTLNSVSALVLAQRNDAAETMIRKLSSFFRSTVAANPLGEISLAEEIGLQQTYLEIEAVRFPDLTIDIDLPNHLGQVMVPTLLLQPLVENAIKYAVSDRDGAARIGIAAWADEPGSLRIAVTDNGMGSSAPGGTGTGLRNVRERLRARFGEDATLTAGPVGAIGFRVDLVIPRMSPDGEASGGNPA